MYHIGDKIVYPFHGAAVIEAIEEKEILGEKQRYFIMKMTIGTVEIMIPTGKTADAGIRRVVDMGTMENVLLLIHDGEFDPSIKWNRRHRINMDKIRTGNIYQGSEVIRDLTRINKERALGASDKKMLDLAMQILISELVLVKEIGEELATTLLDQVVNVIHRPTGIVNFPLQGTPLR